MKNIPENHLQQFVNFIVHSCGKQGSDKVNSDTIKLVECPAALNEASQTKVCFEFEDHYSQTLNITFTATDGTNPKEYVPEVFNETPKGWLKIKWWDENLVLTD